MSRILTAQEFNTQYPQIQQNLAQQFIAYCKIYNVHIPESSVELASRIFFNITLPSRQVPVITLRMGLGKSTLVNLYTKFMRSHDPLYGAMIAVERKETIQQAYHNYDDFYGLYGFDSGDCLKHYEYYNPNACRVCDETECRVQQNEMFAPVSPILMITHARLNLIMQDKRALTDIMYFYDEETRKKEYRRSDLFVDECPGFFTLDKLNEKTFLTFQQAIHSTYRRDCKQRRELINYFKGYIKSIRQYLKSDYEGIFNIDSITETKRSFGQFLVMKKRFMMNYYGSYYQVCLNALNAIHQGGYIRHHTFSAPREHELQTGDHRTFILDGTAHINMSYPQNCLIIDFPDKRVFENVTWNIDHSHNLSKEYYHTHPDFVPKIKDFIIKQLVKHKKILLITFKEFENVYKSYFTDTERERIYIDHFNNLKGKNQYRDATCMFYLGTLYKGDIYYLYYYKYCERLEGNVVNLEQIDFINRDSQRIPIDVKTQQLHTTMQNLIALDQADMIVQDAFRCEPRTDELSITDYYIFCTNDELKEKVNQFFPGAYISNTSILSKDSEEYTIFLQHIKNEFVDKKLSRKMKKSDFMKKYNIPRTTFTKFISLEQTQTVLHLLHLSTSRYYLIFEPRT